MAIVRTRRVIDDAGADAVLSAAERAANEMGHRVVIAVVDQWASSSSCAGPRERRSPARA